jgi:transcriptional antiterminator RfaH
LVSFGGDPARVDGRLIDLLRSQEEVIQHDPERLYKRGEHVCLTAGPFAGVEGVFQMLDGERRVVVLIELLSKQLQVTVVPTGLRKVG